MANESRVRIATTARDTEAERLKKYLAAIVHTAPDRIRASLTPRAADSLAELRAKWERAVTEGAVAAMDLDKSRRYIHRQDVASAVWIINHRLGGSPTVVTVDSTHRVVHAQVDYISSARATVTFSGATTGKAYCTL